MKKLIALLMTVCCSLVLSSCNIPSARKKFFAYPKKEMLNDTMSEFVRQLNQRDAEAMLAMHLIPAEKHPDNTLFRGGTDGKKGIFILDSEERE